MVFDPPRPPTPGPSSRARWSPRAPRAINSAPFGTLASNLSCNPGLLIPPPSPIATDPRPRGTPTSKRHGDGHGAVRLVADGAEGGGAGAEALHDLHRGLHLRSWPAGSDEAAERGDQEPPEVGRWIRRSDGRREKGRECGSGFVRSIKMW